MPPRALKVVGTLMTQQLRRPQGINGLLATIFGDGIEGDDVPLDKLLQVTKILTTVPAAVKPEVYCFSLPFLDSHLVPGVFEFPIAAAP